MTRSPGRARSESDSPEGAMGTARARGDGACPVPAGATTLMSRAECPRPRTAQRTALGLCEREGAVALRLLGGECVALRSPRAPTPIRHSWGQDRTLPTPSSRQVRCSRWLARSTAPM